MAEEIPVRIRFTLVGTRAVAKAVKELKGLEAVQRVTTRTMITNTRAGRVYTTVLQASGKIPARAYAEQSAAVKNVVDKISRWKSVTSAAYDITERSVPVYGRLEAAMAGLRGAAGALLPMARRLRAAAWSVTWAAMSMLGVFFGGFTTVRLFRRGIELLLRPLSDLTSAGETLAKAYAFGLAVGIGPFAAGMLDLGDLISRLPGAWMNLQAVVNGFKALLIAVAIEVFTNEKLMTALGSVLESLARLVPVAVEALVPMAVGAANVGAAIAENVDKVKKWIEQWRDVIDAILRAGVFVMGLAFRMMGLGDMFDRLTKGIERQDSAWGRFGARLAVVGGGLVVTSLTAAILLPILSVFQSIVLAVAAALYVAHGACLAGSMGLKLLTRSWWTARIAGMRFKLMLIRQTLVLIKNRIAAWLSAAAHSRLAMAFMRTRVGALLASVGVKILNMGLWKTIMLVALLTAGLTLLLGLITSLGAAAIAPGVTGGGPQIVESQTVYQSVMIGTVEKTADVDEAVDELARLRYGRYR